MFASQAQSELLRSLEALAFDTPALVLLGNFSQPCAFLIVLKTDFVLLPLRGPS